MVAAAMLAAMSLAVVVIVVVMASSTTTTYKPAKTMTVEIVNEGTVPEAASFEPQTVSVQPHAAVVWKNMDASAHTVTSRDPAGIFDSGVMGPGMEFKFVFEEKDKGTFAYMEKVPYRCG